MWAFTWLLLQTGTEVLMQGHQLLVPRREEKSVANMSLRLAMSSPVSLWMARRLCPWQRQKGVGPQYQIHTKLSHAMALVFLWICQTTFLSWPEPEMSFRRNHYLKISAQTISLSIHNSFHAKYLLLLRLLCLASSLNVPGFSFQEWIWAVFHFKRQKPISNQCFLSIR